MDNNIHYHSCPICGSSGIFEFIKTKDFTVSSQSFAIYRCNDCEGAFTQDAPQESEIHNYYKSDEYISHTDSRKGLVNRLYHLARSISLNSKSKLIDRETAAKGKLLDIGSGTGHFAAMMKNLGWKVTALEPEPAAREMAEKLHGLQTFHPSALFDLEDHQFNAITMWHVLEHVHDLHGYLNKLNYLLAGKGKLFIAVPNFKSYDAMKLGKFWAAYDVPRHLYHFSPTSMKRLLEKHGFRLVKTIPMPFDSFYVSMLGTKYEKGRTDWLRSLWLGLVSNLKSMRDKSSASSLIYVAAK